MRIGHSGLSLWVIYRNCSNTVKGVLCFIQNEAHWSLILLYIHDFTPYMIYALYWLVNTPPSVGYGESPVASGWLDFLDLHPSPLLIKIWWLIFKLLSVKCGKSYRMSINQKEEGFFYPHQYYNKYSQTLGHMWSLSFTFWMFLLVFLTLKEAHCALEILDHTNIESKCLYLRIAQVY